MILADGDLITTTWLPRGITPEVRFETQAREAIKASTASAADGQVLEATSASPAVLFHLPPEGVQLESVEMALVEQAMNRSAGNQTRAAELLGISRDQLRYRLKKLEGNEH
jgi:DNA-binding NtrC family response regulator